MICSGRRSIWSFDSVCIVLLAALTSLARAQSAGLQVRPTEREQFTEEPRNVVATTFIVRNGTGRQIEAEPHLILPPGWRPMTPDLPFALGEQDSALRLISFVIPELAAVGEYPVTYEVRDRQQPGVSATYTVRVNVLAAVKLQVLSLETPDFAVAGERYQSAFLIRNLGNAAVIAKFTVRSAQNAEPEPRAGTVELDAGESKRIEIQSVAPRVRRRAGEQLTLAVEVVGTQLRELASSATEIVPRVSAGEAYRTLASRLEMDFVGRNSDGKRQAGWQPALSGAGTLDEAGTQYLSFALRGPDARESGSLGSADEYWVRYQRHNVSADLGDDVYELSPLTERGRYGFGAKLGYQGQRWGMTTYRMRDRFSPEGLEQSALDTYYRLSRDTVVDINLLRNDGGEFPGMVRSLRSQTRWMSSLSTDLEVGESEGGGECGRAYRGNISGMLGALSYYATGWKADPQYRGYVRDKMYLSTGFDVPRSQGWGLHGYYRIQDWNLEQPQDLLLDSQRPPNPEDLIRFAPTERQATLGTDHALGLATRITLDYSMRTRTDGHSQPAVDVLSQSARVSLSRSMKNLSLLYAIEPGSTRNDISLTQFNTLLQMLSASWRASRTQTYGFFLLRDASAYSNEREPMQTTFGLSASFALAARTSLSLNAQRNDTQTRRGALYDMALIHQQPDGGRLALTARRIDARRTLDDVRLTYSRPFAIPIARRPDVGSVRGRVFDSETGAGLRSVVLNLDGLTAVTDANGAFEFPVVKANTYRLSMDRANVDVGKVPVDRFPLDVDVTPHGLQQVQVALVRTATVNVTVKLRAPDSNGSDRTPLSAPSVVGAQNVLVTLTHGHDVYRRLTSADGRVRVGGLAPGTWTATLAPETIPQGYTVAAREQRLEVAPGVSASAEFELTPRIRDIHMLPPLQVMAR